MERLDSRDYVKIRRLLADTVYKVMSLRLELSCARVTCYNIASMCTCMRAIKNLEKLLKMCLDLDLKMKNSKKSSKIVKKLPLSNRKTVSSSALRSGGSIV